ncbi:thiazole synthase [uncultured Desulfuromusa sp.]|uniref:thiazole synthase n=1 Tax=uncultured Desulfuromusa sp. TaxID=219183 RepID=UPI002AA876C3|nr:thiazole synthase [uncultured Desulfuromusa sp.]
MDPLIIAGRPFNSRLLVGTGKFSSNQSMVSAMENSGSEIVTVALRRVDIDNPDDSILSHIDTDRYLLLPNTSGARDAEEAVRLARLARAAGCLPWVKLEVTPDPYYLLPDPIETFKAAEILVKEGFVVLPYMPADPVLAKRLEEIGTATVMPLGAPIGTNRGIRTRDLIAIIIEQSNIPVIVDAGLGAPSHAAEAMEMGADAVLVNTALADTPNPDAMAQAFRKGVEAGREAYLAGLGTQRVKAEASSPLTGFLRNEP